MILYIIFVAEPPAKPSAEEKLSVGEKTPLKKPTATAASLKEGEKKLLSTQHQTGPPKCPYGFGYLKKQDKNAPIPDECLSCRRMLECFSSGE